MVRRVEGREVVKGGVGGGERREVVRGERW